MLIPTSSTPSAPIAPAPTITEDPVVDPTLDDGDHDRFAHIVKKEDANRAYITGEPITALCGKKWTPSRDPDKYPVCPSCKEVLEAIQAASSN